MQQAIARTPDMMTPDSIWEMVQSALKKEFGEATYKSWFSKISFVELKENRLILAAPTKFIREWILNHYANAIAHHWHTASSQAISIELIIQANSAAKKPAASNATATVTSAHPVQDESFAGNSQLLATLDPRFTFDTFIVGKPNALAHAAARSVAESTTVQSGCNPLFLYGGVGLGKTHLMHSIAWHIHQTTPHRKVMYLSAEKFMYRFVQALREKDIMSFKEQFRSVDVLMIDDIQFICGKDSTQEEFFHTFNALIDNNRQLVFSCDRSPSDLDKIEERVRSRLGWGLVADIHTTTYELRLGILASKIEQMGVDVSQDVIEFLASKISSNVRELEGALNKVIAHSNLMGLPISLESTQEILRDLLRSNERVVTIDEIQKKVAEHYNIRITDMSSSRRLRSIARPRQVAMYLSKHLTSRSLAEIGRKFGGKDHTTVMHAVKKVEELCEKDSEFSEDIMLLTRILRN